MSPERQEAHFLSCHLILLCTAQRRCLLEQGNIGSGQDPQRSWERPSTGPCCGCASHHGCAIMGCEGGQQLDASATLLSCCHRSGPEPPPQREASPALTPKLLDGLLGTAHCPQSRLEQPIALAFLHKELTVLRLAWEPCMAFHLGHQSPQPCH